MENEKLTTASRQEISQIIMDALEEKLSTDVTWEPSVMLGGVFDVLWSLAGDYVEFQKMLSVAKISLNQMEGKKSEAAEG